MKLSIPTEPIGSIPRPLGLIEAVGTGDGTDPKLDPFYDDAIADTIARFEATGSPVITDGEQRKYHNFWTYSDDTSTSRDTAFAKIRSRVLGNALASEILGGR